MKNLLTFFLCLASALTVNAQSLSLFDIDASNFPTMKAKFWAFDVGGNQVRPSTSEFTVIESGQPRTITSVTCPPPQPPIAISSVLTVDVSGSMSGGSGGTANINLAKVAAKAWILGLPTGQSECALSSFDDNNYLNQDFTTDRSRLLSALSTLSPNGGTNYDMGLLQPLAGSLQISQRGQHKRVVVFLSDGMPNTEPNTSAIVAEAKKQNCIIFAVTLGMSCPQSLKDISSQTGGQWYENVTSTPEAEEVYRKIMQVAIGGEPCEITWESSAACEAGNTNLELTLQTQKAQASYLPPAAIAIASLKVTPTFITFGKRLPSTLTDTSLTLIAKNADFAVTGISRKYGSAEFTVVNTTFPISIPKNMSKTITLRFAPSDSGIKYASFEIATDKCPGYFSANAGFPSKKITTSTLKITKPNGGEVFAMGSDTLITWEGIAPTDTVSLEFSADNGVTWKLLTTEATGLKYAWKNVPKPPSAKCLVRVKQGGNEPSGVSPYIEWQKSLGGDNSDEAKSIQQSLDGGYVVAGYSKSNNGDVKVNHGNYDYWVVKLSPLGAIEWQKSLGGGGEDKAYSIQQCADGGFIVAGFNASTAGDVTGNHGSYDSWVVKLTSLGAVEWQKSLGGSDDDRAQSIQQCTDGGYIVAGESASNNGDVTGNHGYKDYWVVKLSPVGDIEWQKSLGGSGNDNAYSIQQSTDGGFIVSGNSSSNDGDVSGYHGGEDYWVVKLSPTGAIEWQKSLGGSRTDWAYSIQQSVDGGYVVAGVSGSDDGDVSGNLSAFDYWVVKLSPAGAIEWQKSLGGSWDDRAYNIQQCIDGGYIVAGGSMSKDGNVTGNHVGFDYWVVKLSIAGDVEWQKSLGGYEEDMAQSIQQCADGGYIVAGNSNSEDGDKTMNHGRGNVDYWVVKLSPDGVVLQPDTSDSVFSIVAPLPKSTDVDMLQCLVGSVKDSFVATFVQNQGTFPFRVDSIQITGADASQFSLVSGIPPFDVPAGGNHAVEFRFRPSSVGVKTAQLLIFIQADTLHQTIRGEGIAPALTVVNSLIDFGRILVGEKKDTLQTLTIKNIGTAALTITATRHAGPNDLDFSTLSGGGSFVLQAGGTAKLDLRFTATELGRTSGRLLFEYNGVGSPATIQLFGEGIATLGINPSILASSSIAFDSVCVGNTDSRQATIANNGTVPLQLLRAEWITNSGNVFTTSLTHQTLAVDSSVVVNVNILPTAIGMTSAQVRWIADKDTAVSSISGIGKICLGINPSILATSDIPFDSVCIGHPESRKATIKNNGTEPLQLLRAEWITNTGNVFTTSLPTQPLAVDSSIIVPIYFLPTAVGMTSAQVRWIADKDTAVSTVSGIGKVCTNIPDTSRTTVIAQDITAQAGEKVNLSLKLFKPTRMDVVGAPTDWYARIHYNKSILFNEQTNNVCPGMTDSCVLELTGVYNPKSDEFISIPCIATLGNTDHSTIVIDTFYWKNSVIATDVATQNGTITITGTCEDGGVRLFIPAKNSTSLATRPNPAQDKLQIQYGLREPLTVTLELLNMTGQVVQTIITNQTQAAGQYTLTSDLSVLGNGVYLLRLRTNKDMLTTRVDVVK